MRNQACLKLQQSTPANWDHDICLLAVRKENTQEETSKVIAVTWFSRCVNLQTETQHLPIVKPSMQPFSHRLSGARKAWEKTRERVRSWVCTRQSAGPVSRWASPYLSRAGAAAMTRSRVHIDPIRRAVSALTLQPRMWSPPPTPPAYPPAAESCPGLDWVSVFACATVYCTERSACVMDSVACEWGVCVTGFVCVGVKMDLGFVQRCRR